MNEKRKNLKRKRAEENEALRGSQPQMEKQQQEEEKSTIADGGGERRDHFSDLPNELISKILLNNFDRKELARSVSLTCKTFHRIARPRMHVLGEFPLPHLDIVNTNWDGLRPHNIVRRFAHSGRICPLSIGPIPNNIAEIGTIKLRSYDGRICQFLQSLGPLLQNDFTLRISLSEHFVVEMRRLMENLFAFGRISRIEFPDSNSHPFPTNLHLFLRVQSIYFNSFMYFVRMRTYIFKWLFSPHPEGKPRILCINAIFIKICGKFIERIKKIFLTENGPPVSFVVKLKGRPVNVADFTVEKADTGECLVLENNRRSDDSYWPYWHMRIFRGPIGQTFDEMNMEEDIGARRRVVEFCNPSFV